ncbi:MAG: hypothetical protein J6Y56_05755 [Fibrobacterales bacterium]|nr:hypothetical protein [Fibrobacterales bacterium]
MPLPLRSLSARVFALLALCLAAAWAQPEPGYKSAWKHFQFAVFVHGAGHFETGDLDGKGILDVNPGDTSSVQGTFYKAEPGAGFSVGGGLGARMDANRLSFAVDWSSATMTHELLPGSFSTDLWRFGLDYRHDFLYPADFRPEVGGGAHFSFRDMDGAFDDAGGEDRSARLSGTGIHLDGGVGWWWNERFVVLAELEYELTANRNIGFGGGDGVEIPHYLVEHSLRPKIALWALF